MKRSVVFFNKQEQTKSPRFNWQIHKQYNTYNPCLSGFITMTLYVWNILSIQI